MNALRTYFSVSCEKLWCLFYNALNGKSDKTAQELNILILLLLQHIQYKHE
jgi:hypothetical protein